MLAAHFGRDLKGLAGFSNVSVRVVSGTDHNMTPVAARAVVTEEILRLCGRDPVTLPLGAPVNAAAASAVLGDDQAAA